ncbi:MAG TPA: lytic transglycosylase domain-containing protein [Pyrinomonadaceae bacterium]|jgi:soluble lytic murein transglycosylase|nr:lytic transglycosylase domain-containing protein [Pyrinomonadaceae bacterium]
MKRAVVFAVLVLTIILSAFFLNYYWIHRYDSLIARQAAIYRVDPDLVWSIIYEETYFSPWKIGKDGEIGLMQVTPTVGKEWAAATGMKQFERQMSTDPGAFLAEAEHNIQVGCWYLEKIHEQFQDATDSETRMVAAYNAGPSRVVEWSRVAQDAKPQTSAEFIARIDIPSTRAYVISIMQRYRQLKTAKNQAITVHNP